MEWVTFLDHAYNFLSSFYHFDITPYEILRPKLNYPQKVRHLSGDILNGKGNF